MLLSIYHNRTPLNGYRLSVTARQHAVNNILDGLEDYVMDTDGIICSTNLEAVNITGYEEWEIIGKHFRLFYADEDILLGQPEKDLEMAMQTGVLEVCGFRMKKKKTGFWAEARLTSLLNEQGDITGFRLTLRDSTHKIINEQKLKRLEFEYETLLNNQFVGIIKVRASNFEIMSHNQKAQSIFSCVNLKEISFDQLFHNRKDFETFKDELVQHHVIKDYEFENKVCGKPVWVSISCSYYPDEDFFEGLILDVTKRKEDITELEILNQELDQFVYHASHDLRAPLTTLMGLVNLCKQESSLDRIKQYTKMMEERIIHLDYLQKDLISITYNSKSEIARDYFDFDKEIKMILKEVYEEYWYIQVSLAIEGLPGCHADGKRLRVILRNIIFNALKYHNPEADSSTVHISVNTTDRMITISVKDNGIGIPKEFHKKIFGMFFKATTTAKGAGLGLYIVKSMLDKLHGQVEVHSEPGIGTEVTVTIPNSL